MKKTSIAIFVLAAALVASNAGWLYRSLDFGVSHTYQMQSCSEDSEILKQTLSILPVAAQPNSNPASIISAARLSPEDVIFEKDGFTWVGRLGLRFNNKGRLQEVTK